MSPDDGAVVVKSATGAYTAAGAIGTFIVAVIGLIGVWVKFGPRWREVALTADQKLREDLLERVTKLEKTLEGERARHDAERALDRHRINNLQQCLDAVFMLFEAAPERATDMVVRIKEMRARQIETETLEKAAIHAAEITAKGEGAAG